MSLKAVFTDSKGNKKLIKVPWYAALAGASPTRPPKVDPKIKPCNSCKGQGKCAGCGGKGKVGGSGGKDHSNQKSGGGGGGGGGGGNKDQGNQGHSTNEQETYSEEDDKTIIEMKAANAVWKEILAAINHRSESQLKAHWKNDLQAKAEGSGGGGGGNDGNKGDGGKGGQQQQQGKGGGGKGQGKKGGLDEQMAKELEKQESRKWENMASRHFDKTGERISAEEAKKRYAK